MGQSGWGVSFHCRVSPIACDEYLLQEELKEMKPVLDSLLKAVKELLDRPDNDR